MSELQPSNTDAILGGQTPPPVDAAVLGGVAGAKQRLQHEKALAREQKFWRNFEYLNRPINRVDTNYQHAAIFADRRVINFEPDLEIINPKENAYAIRVFPGIGGVSYEDKLLSLIDKPNVNQIEALVFGATHYGKWIKPFDFLINSYDALPNLQAIFLDDFNQEDMRIGRIAGFSEGNLSQVLSRYPQLQLLQIRNGHGYIFNECRHEKLKALRIEMTSHTWFKYLNGINKLDLPALEYLELWLDGSMMDKRNIIRGLSTLIFSGYIFPKLKYLGVKNCIFTDEIAASIATSSAMERLVELDFSVSNLSEEGLVFLLNSDSINELAILNVSNTFISQEIVKKNTLGLELKCEIILDNYKYVG
jgi:hypothetical protein